jgi:hypothetical protein
LLQVPWSRVEAIRLGGQGAHGTDLYGVAGKDRVERLGGRRRDFDEITATGEGDLGIAGDIGGEPRAARALDAPFAV